MRVSERRQKQENFNGKVLIKLDVSETHKTLVNFAQLGNFRANHQKTLENFLNSDMKEGRFGDPFWSGSQLASNSIQGLFSGFCHFLTKFGIENWSPNRVQKQVTSKQ